MELEEAYATLHNQRSREKYDKLGYDGERKCCLVSHCVIIACFCHTRGMRNMALRDDHASWTQ